VKHVSLECDCLDCLRTLLAKHEQHLDFLLRPERSDYHGAAEGTYYEPDQLGRSLRICRRKIADLKPRIQLEEIRCTNSRSVKRIGSL
jgi:hypothetical protein